MNKIDQLSTISLKKKTDNKDITGIDAMRIFGLGASVILTVVHLIYFLLKDEPSKTLV